MKYGPITANTLRREIHARAAQSEVEYELSFGSSASVLFAEDEEGDHGNFLAASVRTPRGRNVSTRVTPQARAFPVLLTVTVGSWIVRPALMPYS